MVVAVVQQTHRVYILPEEMVVVLKDQIIIRLMVVMELYTPVVVAVVDTPSVVKAVLVVKESS